jgi:hypothetical protein
MGEITFDPSDLEIAGMQDIELLISQGVSDTVANFVI